MGPHNQLQIYAMSQCGFARRPNGARKELESTRSVFFIGL